MARYALLFCVVTVAGIGALFLTGRKPSPSSVAAVPATVGANRLSPTEREIQKSETMIRASPSNPEGYIRFAAACMQRARETGDFDFNAKAETSLKKALELSPESFGALNLQAQLEVVHHRFDKAVSTARRALKVRPDSPDLYGVLADAQVELGEYKAALDAAQRLMDLRPDATAHARAAHLRYLHGDTEGAVEAMHTALEAARPGDTESVAWYRVHLGKYLTNAGLRKQAERQYDLALELLPDYVPALTEKIHARFAAGDPAGAVEYAERAQNRVPLPETAVWLGELYSVLGRETEAKRQFEMVELIERKLDPRGGRSSRLLVRLWADQRINLDEALAVARRARAASADINTCDTLAWCLYKKNMLAEARTAIEEAMRLGTNDARILHHAGLIYRKLGDRAKARRFLEKALAADPAFQPVQAGIAREVLKQL